jgi:hypothetical protein
MPSVSDYSKFERLSPRDVNLENAMNDNNFTNRRISNTLNKNEISSEIKLEVAMDRSDFFGNAKKNNIIQKMVK